MGYTIESDIMILLRTMVTNNFFDNARKKKHKNERYKQLVFSK